MTPEEINKAMAELDGWKVSTSAGYRWTSPDGTRELRLPHDYTQDLNAVARVAGKLGIVDWWKYRDRLFHIGDAGSIDATALQRCEAILRAVGKWVEG